MRLVQFKDGSWGVKRGLFSSQYLDIRDSRYGDLWWCAPESVDLYCKGTLEDAAKAMGKKMSKTPIDLLQEMVSELATAIAGLRCDTMTISDRNVRPYTLYPYIHGDREVQTSTVLYAILDKLGLQAVSIDGKIVIEDKHCDKVIVRKVPDIKVDSVIKSKKVKK